MEKKSIKRIKKSYIFHVIYSRGISPASLISSEYVLRSIARQYSIRS